MAIFLLLIGGDNDHSASLFFMFKNAQLSYPTVEKEHVEGVAHHSQTTAWMVRFCFNQQLNEFVVVAKANLGTQRVLFVDNVAGHGTTPEIIHSLEEIRTTPQNMPVNTKNLCQSLDDFIIKVIEGQWRAVWGKENMERIKINN